jgi:hypothetical protein
MPIRLLQVELRIRPRDEKPVARKLSEKMISQMNLSIPGRKGMDVENLSMTDALEISDEGPVLVLSNKENKIELAKELRKGRIQRPSPNEERGHPSLVDGQDTLSVETLIHQFKNSWVADDDQLRLGKGLSKAFEDW